MGPAQLFLPQLKNQPYKMLYNKQSLITITLDTGVDTTTASVKKILYEKPGKIKGEWTATSSTTFLSYNLSNGDIDVPGLWKFQAYLEIGGKKSYGTIVTENFDTPLN